MPDNKINGWTEWGRHVLKTLDDLEKKIDSKVADSVCEERMMRIEELAKEAKKAAESARNFVIVNILVVIAIGVFMHNF
jgi:hypothetical protein